MQSDGEAFVASVCDLARSAQLGFIAEAATSVAQCGIPVNVLLFSEGSREKFQRSELRVNGRKKLSVFPISDLCLRVGAFGGSFSATSTPLIAKVCPSPNRNLDSTRFAHFCTASKLFFKTQNNALKEEDNVANIKCFSSIS